MALEAASNTSVMAKIAPKAEFPVRVRLVSDMYSILGRGFFEGDTARR